VLGTSPETAQAGIRKILGQYGEVLDCQKGFISKKLPGCTNGIWTVKLLLKAWMSLPPFLIMKDEWEVWQLATGESSVARLAILGTGAGRWSKFLLRALPVQLWVISKPGPMLSREE
jgi:hypothetical protein